MKLYGNTGNLFTVKEFINRQQNKFQDGLKKQKKFEKEVPESIKRIREIQEQRKREAENLKNDQVAKKIARGQYVTTAERKKLYKDSPEKFQKAVLAAKMREGISKRLKQARTKEEKLAILSEGKSFAVSVATKGDQELGELYLEGIDKAEKEDLKKDTGRRSPSLISDDRMIDKNSRTKFDLKG